MNLNECTKGTVYVIKKINANKDTIQHLSNLGCRVGEEIAIVNKIGKNIIFSVLDGRYGIDQNMANLIEVE